MNAVDEPPTYAEPVLRLALSRPPTLGDTRLVCVDGPAGSGKTTFAAALERDARSSGLTVEVVHMDDVFEGWDGLADAGRRVRTGIVEPLVDGRAGGYARYDWHEQRFAEQVPVHAVDLLIIEGVGSGDAGYGQRIGVLVWIWAPEELRLRRGLERDGATMERRWRQWMIDEHQLHTRDRTAERADVLVDGRSGDLRTVT